MSEEKIEARAQQIFDTPAFPIYFPPMEQGAEYQSGMSYGMWLAGQIEAGANSYSSGPLPNPRTSVTRAFFVCRALAERGKP